MVRKKTKSYIIEKMLLFIILESYSAIGKFAVKKLGKKFKRPYLKAPSVQAGVGGRVILMKNTAIIK